MTRHQTLPTPEWLPTSQAARALGVSNYTLKRYARRDKLLQEGRHYRRGPYANSTFVWHVERCFEALRGGVKS